MNDSSTLYNESIIKKVAAKRFRKYLREISIFTKDDLAQEIWVYILSHPAKRTDAQLEKLADIVAANLCKKARNRYQIVEFINFSDLSKRDIAKTGDWDELYEKPETWG